MTLHCLTQSGEEGGSLLPCSPENKVDPAQEVLLGKPFDLDSFRGLQSLGVCASPLASPSLPPPVASQAADPVLLGLRAEAWSSTCWKTSEEVKQPLPSSPSGIHSASIAFPLHLPSEERPNCHLITLWP